jgi:hypothetical protein
MTPTTPTKAAPKPAPAATDSRTRHQEHRVVTTEPIGTATFGVRPRWAALAVPAFTIGWAFAQVTGEVVGEAWGGDFLHLTGHAIGTVLVVGLVSLAGWLVLRHHVAWASRGAAAATVGSVVGLALYVPILALAPDTLSGLTIALTLHLPLIMAATFQARALRSRLRRPRRWALAWFVGILLGVAVAWYAGGGLDGASTGSFHPVLDKAIAYWWRMIPRSVLGALIFALWTARTVPLHGALPSGPD